MALQQADLDQIVTHIKPQFSLWIMEQGLDKPAQLYEMELRERTIRVEEELKHQRELMQQGFKEMEVRFEKMDRRFDLQREEMEARFEKMDRRLELQREEINKHVELQRTEINKRFELQREEMNKRFEQVDKRFEQVDKRFEQVDQRFVVLTQRIDRFMVWSFGSTVAVAGIVITVLRFWP